jgi:hypothetical protein
LDRVIANQNLQRNIEAGLFEKAQEIISCENSDMVDCTYTNFLLLRGRLELQTGKFTNALSHLEEALDLSNFQFCWVKKKKMLPELSKEVFCHPKCAEVAYYLAAVYFQKEMYKNAERLFLVSAHILQDTESHNPFFSQILARLLHTLVVRDEKRQNLCHTDFIPKYAMQIMQSGRFIITEHFPAFRVKNCVFSHIALQSVLVAENSVGHYHPL